MYIDTSENVYGFGRYIAVYEMETIEAVPTIISMSLVPVDGLHVTGMKLANDDMVIMLKTDVVQEQIRLKWVENHTWANTYAGLNDALAELLSWINAADVNPT